MLQVSGLGLGFRLGLGQGFRLGWGWGLGWGEWFGLGLGSPPHLATEITHGRDEREPLTGGELRLGRGHAIDRPRHELVGGRQVGGLLRPVGAALLPPHVLQRLREVRERACTQLELTGALGAVVAHAGRVQGERVKARAQPLAWLGPGLGLGRGRGRGRGRGLRLGFGFAASRPRDRSLRVSALHCPMRRARPAGCSPHPRGPRGLPRLGCRGPPPPP